MKMKRVFKTKRKRNYKIILFILVVLSSIFMANYMIKNTSNEFIIDGKLNHFNINIDKERILLKMGLNYKKANKIIKKEEPVFNELQYDFPKVYIYNTHNREEYNGGTVIDAANKLKEELRNFNIDAIVETKDIVGEVKAKNLAYKDTYKITRELVKSKLSENIVLYIDLHRDSVKREFTTAQVDGKSYAKMLFVVGAKHDTYKENYQVCDEINKYIKNNNNAFSRGILVRKSSSYNQDLASNVILIELGSQDNTIEEVNNSIGILANALSSYINE